MLNKEQKKQIVEREVLRLKNLRSVVFIDFAGVKAGDLNSFRRDVREVGELSVVKKRLLRVAFEKAGIDFNPEIFEAQLGTIFSGEDLQPVAALTYKFKEAKIIGGYDLSEKKFMPADEVIALGKLPSREVLLSQVVGMVASPIRSFLFVLNERSKSVSVGAATEG